MGKGIVKLGEGNWAVKDGNLLAAKETNGRFKNAEFTVARGTDATYVGRDGLIKRFSSGLANEVANGDFELGDNGDWTLPSGWSISNNQLVGNDPTGFATVNDVFYANKSYRLDVDVAEVDSGDFTIIPNSTDSNSNGTTAIGSTGLHTFYFHIGTIDLETLYVTFSGDFIGKINSITVRDIEDFDDRPRIDFTNNTDGHLLLEPQSTNLITYSEDFTTWIIQSGTTVYSNTTETLSPSGEYNASKITSDGSNGLFKVVTFSGGDNTKSIFLKGIEGGEQVKLKDPSQTITTETLTLTTDWVRYNLSENQTLNIGLWIDDIPSNGIYMWGAQLEALPHPTSYIPTNGSTVTRDAETCTGAGEAADFNSEEGVLYAEIAALDNDTSDRDIYLSDTTASNRIRLRFDSSNNINALLYNGSIQFNTTQSLTDATNFNKIAFKYKTNDFALWINGTEVYTDTNGTVCSGLNDLSFWATYISDNNFYGKCKAIRVYKEALSDTDLETLTS